MNQITVNQVVTNLNTLNVLKDGDQKTFLATQISNFTFALETLKPVVTQISSDSTPSTVQKACSDYSDDSRPSSCN
jgi:hypothetical protein